MCPGVRRDSGVYEGWTVPTEYDPLLAKLVVWGTDRDEAIARMRRALSEYEVFGIQTNIPFFRQILEHPEFIAGRCDTGFIDRVFTNYMRREDEPPKEEQAVAMLVAGLESALRRNGQGRAGALRAGQDETASSSEWRIAAREAALNRWPSKKRSAVASG